MIKSIKIRLNPNNKQKTKLFQYSDYARFAYNWAISKEKEAYKNGDKFKPDYQLRKEFTQLKKQPEFYWLNQISNEVTKQAIKDACFTYKRFFKGLQGCPEYKTKKKSHPSFYQDGTKLRFSDTHVKVEGFAESKGKSRGNRGSINWIRLCKKGRIPTNCKYMNPRFTYDGLHWYVSVGIEVEPVRKNFNENNEGIGIDLGIKDFAIFSDGSIYPNINKTELVKKIEKQKLRLQHSLSRKYLANKKGGRYCKTKNIIKSEKKFLKLSKRLTNIRHNYLHQITSLIAKREPSFVCIEDLHVSEMMKNKHLSKFIQQQSFYEFRKQLEYKCHWNGVLLIIADRWFPSSKLCSCCGNVKKDLKLSDRIYKCECGNVIDRDYQAALNLKVYGENILKQQSVV